MDLKDVDTNLAGKDSSLDNNNEDDALEDKAIAKQSEKLTSLETYFEVELLKYIRTWLHAL